MAKATAKTKHIKVSGYGDTVQALKNATLIVSLLINLTVLIVWLIMKLTTGYDGELAKLLLNR